jgi:zinc protease
MKILFLTLLFFVSITLSAQEVPLNPEVLFGKLDNGLTYYIQKNSLPKERAMFYLVVNAGAIDEDDNQNGLAHFCEHMAFNGTRNFPDKTLLNYMAKNGVSFGKGVNAFTNTNITCYNLNDVPTTREALIDSSLIILHEWATNVSFSTDEINKERGVIHEEWRTRGGAGRRMSDKTNKVLYNESKYAYHNVIGTLDVIDNADPELLRKFYKDFYRPDLQAVIVVGDIDENMIKAKIEKLFGGDPKKENPVRTAKVMVPGNKELMISFATDKEAQNISITQYIKFPDAPKKDLDYLKNRMIYSLYNSMFSDRFSELLQKENPPMLFAYSGFGGFTEHQSSYTISTMALNADPLRSLKAVMIENERVKRFGFTETELERVKKRTLVSYEKAYLERDKRMSSIYVSGYMNHFSAEVPSAGIEYSLELAKSYLPTVTIGQINELAKKWMTDENKVMIVQGPEKEGIRLPTEAEIKSTLAEVQQMTIEPYTDKVVSGKLISKELKGSPVVKEEFIKAFGGTKLTLANGAKVYFKSTDNKADEIIMTAFSNGGTSLVPTEDLPSASLAGSVSSICGIGDYSTQDLRKLLSGKVANVGTLLTGLEEIINGNSSVSDLETMLQLVYLNFTAQRRDDAAMKSAIGRTKIMLQNRKSNPNSAFSDTLSMLMSNYSPRTSLVTPEYFDRVILEKSYDIARDRFQDASDFNFIFVGNVDVQKMKPLIEKYIGSIPDTDRKEYWIDHKEQPKKGSTTKEIMVEMKDPKATVFVHYFGEIPCTPENVEYLNAIQYILRMRFTETIREKEGGTYGVSVSNTLYSRPVNNYKFTMSFTCAPLKADFLKGLLYDEIKKIKETGVTDAEVFKTKENFLKEAGEKLKNNSFIIDRVKDFVNNGRYTPVPEYTTDIFNNLNGKKIQKLARQVFKDDVVELVMKPVNTTTSDSNQNTKPKPQPVGEPLKLTDTDTNGEVFVLAAFFN